MIYIICNTYAVLFSAFFIAVLIDWAFGIDKLNPKLDKLLENMGTANTDILFPSVCITFIGLLSGLMYLCTGFMFFHIIYFMAICSALVISSFFFLCFGIYKVLLCIRNFILSKKNKKSS